MASIQRLTRTRNGLGQHKYKVRFRIPGRKNQVNRHIWAASPAEVERQVALWRGELQDDAVHGLTWAEAYPLWWDKVGKQFNAGYQKTYETVIRQFTEKRYDVRKVGKGGDGRQQRIVTDKAEGCGIGEGLPIAATKAQHLSDFMDWRRDRRVAELKAQGKDLTPQAGNAAANKAREVLLAMARALRDEGVLPNRPLDFEAVRKRTWRRTKSKVYDPALLPQYLDALPPEARLPVEWMLFTGWRSTPTCTLREDHVDESKGFARNVHKGGKDRDEPLDDVLRDILHRARALKEEKGAAHRPTVFVNLEGHSWNKDSLYQRCTDRWAAAGLPKRKIHELRTTFGTEALKNFTVAQAQAALGHDNLSSTEHYNDQSAMDIAEVGAAVRVSFRSQIFPANAKNQGWGSKPKNKEYVRITCPDLSVSRWLERKKALSLFDLAP